VVENQIRAFAGVQKIFGSLVQQSGKPRIPQGPKGFYRIIGIHRIAQFAAAHQLAHIAPDRRESHAQTPHEGFIARDRRQAYHMALIDQFAPEGRQRLHIPSGTGGEYCDFHIISP
jgi:hypothetical protein